MTRFSKTETALLNRLRALKAKPEMSLNLLDVARPMQAAGFSRDEIMAVIDALEQDKVVAYGPGNRLLILNELPLPSA
jgi:hypothetical protein